MPARPSAKASGEFRILEERPVRRLGFGAMRVTGPGIWGPPADVEGARATLRRLRDLDVDFIDTADAYGPFVSEDLIRETLHPYGDVLVATKGGLTRHGPQLWRPLGRPEYLRQCVLMSMRRLGVERIDLWQLHRIDPKVPAAEQFDAIAQMQKEGLIRYAGLSEVNVDEIRSAQKHFPVATVQNQYNLFDRQSEAVLQFCEQHDIGFIPWFPLGAGKLAGPESALSKVAVRLEATPAQIALAWTLKRSKVMLPIPGTSKVNHLDENVATAALALTDDDFAALDRQGRA
jgi:pyridoxine 4-dehydrogenase